MTLESARRTARKERILSKLDETYGAKYRNEALKLAQEAANEDGKAPDGELDVYLLLDKKYSELKDKDKTSEKDIPIDNGSGGVTFKEGDVKEGKSKRSSWWY